MELAALVVVVRGSLVDGIHLDQPQRRHLCQPLHQLLASHLGYSVCAFMQWGHVSSAHELIICVGVNMACAVKCKQN